MKKLEDTGVEAMKEQLIEMATSLKGPELFVQLVEETKKLLKSLGVAQNLSHVSSFVEGFSLGSGLYQQDVSHAGLVYAALLTIRKQMKEDIKSSVNSLEI